MQGDISSSRILIVDDVKANVSILIAALKDQYKLSVATSGMMALEQVKLHPPDLVLLDVMMPGMDGYEVCEKLKDDAATRDIPVIFITAMNDIGDKSRGFGLGAVDYITKPFQIIEVKARVRTHLMLKKAMETLSNHNRTLDATVRERTRELRDTQLEIIYRLSRAAEFRDNETGMHIKRMSHFCRSIAAAMDCDEQTCELIFHASPMHDIGKIGIPDGILLKPGGLDAEEWAVMKTHTTIGADILSGHDSLLLQTGRTVALTHHEKWDGSGYPQGLLREKIPLLGRISAVSDVFDALMSDRPYKKAWPLEKALEEMRACAGKAFDPAVIDAFFRVLPELLAIKERFEDV